MYPLQNDDDLYRVVTYELHREGKLFNIEVAYCIAGKMPSMFIASVLCDGYDVSDDFDGIGATEVAALHDCLAKLKDLSVKQILSRGGRLRKSLKFLSTPPGKVFFVAQMAAETAVTCTACLDAKSLLEGV